MVSYKVESPIAPLFNPSLNGNSWNASQDNSLDASHANKANEPSVKYRKSGLTSDEVVLIWYKLLHFMKEEKPYVSCTLNLKNLSEYMKLSPNYLSQVINTHTDSHFFDFLNIYRINHAKDLLIKQQRKPLLDVALESGFCSQSSFSTRFKKVMGMTPSQFLKSN